MRIHDIAFYAAGFFLVGVLIAGFGLNFEIIATAIFLIAAVFLLIGYLKEKSILFWFGGLVLIVVIGAFYYSWHDSRQAEKINLVFDEEISFQAMVTTYPGGGEQQRLVAALQPPYSGKITVKLRPYPRFDYGDLIEFKGRIENPEPASYANYLAKDGIFGVVNFPETELKAKNQGSFVKSKLFKLKEKMLGNFQKSLPLKKAALLSGIILGEKSEFSREFKEAMNKSGTSHITALSGYNVTILVNSAMLVFVFFLRRRRAFILSILVVVFFVLMTGAEASVVRAGIMGFVLLLAGQMSRVYNPRNAIAITAFLMIAFNPKILRFDVGFQLSFLALIGIVYLGPIIRRLLRLKDEAGVLSWRENLTSTISAQVLAAPILISAFNGISLVSLFTNILILGFIPLTMALGFFAGILGFVSYYLSAIAGWFAGIFLGFEIFIIDFFGRFNVFNAEISSPWFIIVYYLAMFAMIILFPRFSNEKP